MTREEARQLGLRANTAGFIGKGTETLCHTPMKHHSALRWSVWDRPEGTWPDFRDPASLGILMAQVREKWNDTRMWAECDSHDDMRWNVMHFIDHRSPNSVGWGTTEAEAWVSALEKHTQEK